MPRRPSILLLALALATPAFARTDDAAAPPVSCGNGIPGGVNCILTKKDLKQARTAFQRGLKLRDQRDLDAAFTQFDEAARLMPQNPQFLSAREMVKAQLVFDHVERGNLLLLENSRPQAIAEFRQALNLDPENQFAQERLQEASTPQETAVAAPSLPADVGEIRVQPRPDRATFHFTGPVRGLFTQLGAAYGISAVFDDSAPNRSVVFNVDDVDFFTALQLACDSSKSMWSALDTHQILIAADNSENHKQFDRMSLRAFDMPPHSTQQEVTDLVNTLRTMFDMRFVSSGQTGNKIEVRAPQPLLDAAARLFDQLQKERPQVMLDVQVFQIDHQLTRNIGLHTPDTFNLFNIPVAALAGLGGVNIQDLINQLISSGGINQAGGTSLSAILAQLGGQGNSIFSQPLATFGGGLTFMGLSLDQLVASLSTNESWSRSLEHLTMRASQGNDATFHLGSRFPILNASYAPIYNSPAISKVLGNQSYVPPFPSVSYEDLGLSLKTKPTIHGNGDVSLALEMQVRSLTGQTDNGVPIISNREYKGSITLKDGEPAVIAGQISSTDTKSMSGIPGLGWLPGLNQAMVNNSKQQASDELMVIITPHVLANTLRTSQEIWISER